MENSIAITQTSQPSFWGFIWGNPQNRKYLLLGLGISVIEFVVFKLLYPYPDFFSDSYSYIFAAWAHLDISIWPIGYSKFLSGFHSITSSDKALVGFQYFFMQLALLYFYFSILYFFGGGKSTRNILFVFLFINPFTLYLCNTINSDAIFAALSIWWITELIWIIHRPKLYQLGTQAILLFLCFTIRNNAYYYPLVTVAAFYLSHQSIGRKISGIALPFLFIIPFILYTREKAFQTTGTRQFSLFTGWQLANNALYIYDQIEVDSNELSAGAEREINREAVSFFKKVDPNVYRDFLEEYVGNFFIKQPDAPLKQYFVKHFKPRSEMESIKTWAQASAVFEPFGKTLILHNPIAYARFFAWPNVKHYFFPPLSHIGLYNYGENTIDPIAKMWFKYPTNQVKCVSHSLQGGLIVYSALFFFANLYFLIELLAYYRQFKFNFRENATQRVIGLIVFLLLLNFAFSLISTVNILRYQTISLILFFSFSFIVSDYVEKKAKVKKGPVGKSAVLAHPISSPKIEPKSF